MRKFTLLLSLVVFVTVGFAQKAATNTNKNYIMDLPNSAKSAVDVTDTLIPASFLTGTPTLYTASGGYVCGANGYEDAGKAQHFNIGGEVYTVEGVMLWIGAQEITEDSLTIAVYGFDGEPTTTLSSMKVPFAQVTSTEVGEAGDFWYSVVFDTPVQVTGEFAVGVEFTGITTGFGLISTTEGDGGEDAWELWGDGSGWYSFLDASSWGLDIDQAIFPLVSNNLIKDGGFSVDGAISAPWATWSGNGGTASVIDGVCTMVPAAASDQWQLQVNQTGWVATNDSSYELTFTAWADADRVFAVDFEDPNNGYNRFGDSYDEDAVNGQSEWQVAVTTTPTVFKRYVTFKRIKENTKFLFNIMPSASIEKVYIDDISLVKIPPIPVNEVTLTFNVDMSQAIADPSFFVPGTDVVYVTGSFVGWNEPGTGESILLTDENSDGIYTGSVNLSATFGEVQYKYFKNTGWTGGEWDGEPNRIVTIAGEDVTTNDTWVHSDINDLDLNAVSITPNPFNETLVISNAEKAAKIIVSNVLGQKLMTINEINNQQVLSTESLSRGVYFISIIDHNNIMRTERVVKQ